MNVYTPAVQVFRFFIFAGIGLIVTTSEQENVFDARFPVMVYVQAESFENGDSSLYGPEKLLEKDVVVVTFNYRLGILGLFRLSKRR